MTKLVLHTLQDFLETRWPQPELILDPWLRVGGINMIAGARGGGKTGTVLALALAIASGGTFVGSMRAPQPRRVLYVDGEMMPAAIQGRLRKFKQTLPDSIGENFPWQFHLITHADYDFGIPDLSIPGGEGQLLIAEAVDKCRPELVILDNVSSLFRSGEENSNDTCVALNDWLLHFRRRSIATLLVHHTGKPNGETGVTTQRGASKREDLLDTSVMLSEGCAPGDGQVHVNWEYTKHRAFIPEQRRFGFRICYDDAGGRAWIEEAEDRDAVGAVGRRPAWLTQAEQLRDAGGTIGAIADALGVSKSSVGRWLLARERGVVFGLREGGL